VNEVGHSPASRRLGAYILPGDPVWLSSSLAKYYPLLDELVVVAPRSRRGWTGRPIPVDECLALLERLDTRGLRRIVWGDWEDHREPVRSDTAQRQVGIDELTGRVDWILQIDNDEVLPDPAKLLELIDEAEARSIDAVEWPMRVLFRRLRNGRYLEVCASNGSPRYDYPGPIAIRSGSTAVDARRTTGPFLRPTVAGDTQSLQVSRPPEVDEVRAEMLVHAEVILHNSWGREPAEVRRKIRTWGHAAGLRGEWYYWTTWRASPMTWPWVRDFHPFAHGLWPRLRPTSGVQDLLIPPDR